MVKDMPIYLAIIIGLTGLAFIIYGVIGFFVRKNEGDKLNSPFVNIESHNQQGGITAYQVTNIQPVIQHQKRELSDTQTKEIDEYLKKVQAKLVSIEFFMSDNEAMKFARQIKNNLELKGYHAKLTMTNRVSTGIQIGKPDSNGAVTIIIGNI